MPRVCQDWVRVDKLDLGSTDGPVGVGELWMKTSKRPDGTYPRFLVREIHRKVGGHHPGDHRVLFENEKGGIFPARGYLFSRAFTAYKKSGAHRWENHNV